MHRWIRLCYFVLCVYVCTSWFWMIVLFYLYIVRSILNISVYLLIFVGFCCKWFCLVFVVFNAVLCSCLWLFFVTCIVSCPEFVNVFHLFYFWMFGLEWCWLAVFLYLLLLLSFLFMDLFGVDFLVIRVLLYCFPYSCLLSLGKYYVCWSWNLGWIICVVLGDMICYILLCLCFLFL